MTTNTDSLANSPQPVRVSYATGRMLGVADFQAEQDYHRGRLARVLLQVLGTGTVSGLNVQTNLPADPDKVEVQVTPGLALDRLGRMIDTPYKVCIRLNPWLKLKSDTELSDAFKDGKGVVADVFVSFHACSRGKTPSYASQDDYDATDAFTADRLLDSFGMGLVLRDDADPKLPADPWEGLAAAPTPEQLKDRILNGAPAPRPVELPADPKFDGNAVFLARLTISATRAAAGQRPVMDLSKIDVDNHSRLFVYPASLVARQGGFVNGSK